MKLLDQALSISKGQHDKKFSKEELELVQAWLSGVIGVTQVSKVLKMNGTGNVYAFLAMGARKMWQK